MEKPIVIAVFESDSLNRFIYRRMLTLQGEKILFYIFDSDEEGLAMAQNVSFDIAFIDLHYLGEKYRGIELAKKLSALSNKTMIIGMTNLIQKHDIERAAEAGFKTCYEKLLPFDDLNKLLKEIYSLEDNLCDK